MNENKYVEMLEDGTLHDYIIDLQKQNKAYENMRKEAIKLIDYYGITPEQNDNVILRHILKDLLNILNKVGSDK